MAGSHDDIDLFDLLDVSRREDSYSSVLAHALRRSAHLRGDLLARVFEKPPTLVKCDAMLRTSLGKPGIPDITVIGVDPHGAEWGFFVENKIDADEGEAQTERYLEGLRDRIEDPTRAGGIFLTLNGQVPSASGVVAVSHREIAEVLAQDLAVFGGRARLAIDDYIRRATQPWPAPEPDVLVRDLLAPTRGLVPLLAGPAALGTAIARRAKRPWQSNPIWIQGRGHGHPGLQFRLEGWRGTPYERGPLTLENLDIHCELELIDDQPGRLKLHFETCPYMTRREIRRLENPELHGDARATFQSALGSRVAAIPSWKLTNRPLQAAIAAVAGTAGEVVGRVAEEYARLLDEIVDPVCAAIEVVRGG